MGCPTADELRCALCGEEIYGGDYYYRMEEKAVCEFCLERFARRYFSGEYTRAGRKRGAGLDAE